MNTSNKMPNRRNAKIVLVRKGSSLFRPAVSLAIVAAFVGISVLAWQVARSGTIKDVCAVYAADKTCAASLEKVDTQAGRIKGLSGRESLASNRGMLFVFDRAGRQCIWMKDMKFSIDILWLDASRTVTKVAENVAPSTYPQRFCMDNTLFVIELAAGVSKTSALGLGSHIDL